MLNKKELIREVQLMNIKNLKKLDEVCKKYDIRYWVAYGTLIGTVRHRGFIPWDDDIDVEMLREDYEKLCKVPDEEWGEEFLFCSAYSDDERQDKVFGRIFQNNTKIQSYKDVKNWRSRKTGNVWYSSIMLDIFIVDRIPDDDKVWQKIYDEASRLIEQYKPLKLKWVAGNHSPQEKIKEIVKDVRYLAQKNKSCEPWLKLTDRYMKLIEDMPKGSRYGLMCTVDPYKYTYEDIFPLKIMQYEDMMVPVPANYRKMLTDMYGDFLAFPPEEDRYHIQFIYIDFGDGREYVIDPVKGSLGEGKPAYQYEQK